MMNCIPGCLSITHIVKYVRAAQITPASNNVKTIGKKFIENRGGSKPNRKLLDIIS